MLFNSDCIKACENDKRVVGTSVTLTGRKVQSEAASLCLVSSLVPRLNFRVVLQGEKWS